MAYNSETMQDMYIVTIDNEKEVVYWLHVGDIESNLDQYFQGHLI